MKLCSNCKESKPLSGFNRNKSQRDGLQTFCRDCDCKRKRKYYKKNKQKFFGYNKKSKTKRRAQVSDMRSKLGCSNCPETHVACLDFHHTDPTKKEGGVGKILDKGNRKKLEEEIKKCIVLCSNCHRKHHYNLALKETGASTRLSIE